jgi:hypothetical protein
MKVAAMRSSCWLGTCSGISWSIRRPSITSPVKVRVKAFEVDIVENCQFEELESELESVAQNGFDLVPIELIEVAFGDFDVGSHYDIGPHQVQDIPTCMGIEEHIKGNRSRLHIIEYNSFDTLFFEQNNNNTARDKIS